MYILKKTQNQKNNIYKQVHIRIQLVGKNTQRLKGHKIGFHDHQ